MYDDNARYIKIANTCNFGEKLDLTNAYQLSIYFGKALERVEFIEKRQFSDTNINIISIEVEQALLGLFPYMPALSDSETAKVLLTLLNYLKVVQNISAIGADIGGTFSNLRENEYTRRILDDIGRELIIDYDDRNYRFHKISILISKLQEKAPEAATLLKGIVDISCEELFYGSSK